MKPITPSKIVCVGRNYAAHARELGNDVPTKPLLFLKPPSALVNNGDAIVLPADSTRVEHEGEIGVVIGGRARNLTEEAALAAVPGSVALNDVTARDWQKADVQFTRAKGFDTFCPVSAEMAAPGTNWSDLEIVCRVNGVVRQHGKAVNMVFGIPYLIAYISRIMTLEPGDLIATGTPEGVGPLASGDIVEVELLGHAKVTNPVVSEGAQVDA
jgi:2-keto-4-pentenoate hydratase/2-oxohepta-3-ene-1,7-dioic acid hydratase in catechol pathway